MNQLDIVILLAGALAIIGGYRLGFLARAFSWVGLSGGIFVAVQFLPDILAKADQSSTDARLFILIGVLFTAAFAGQALGMFLGHAISRSVPIMQLHFLDHALGGVLGFLGVIVTIWIMIPTMVDAPGWPAHQARRSLFAKTVHEIAPEPPNAVHALRRLVGDNDFPEVFSGLEPAQNAGPPPANSGLSPEVQAKVLASTVKVEGISCGRLLEGSGFVVGRDLVVTNAHVIAGVEKSIEVIKPDGGRVRGTAVLFDADRDLALIRTSGLGQAPLAIGSAKEEVVGAVFGHPGGQNDVRIAPARIRNRVNAVGKDLYNRHQIIREIFILAADLRQGDSGGPLVDQSGLVVGVAFAIAPDEPGTAYALASSELNRALANSKDKAVGTGECLAA